MNNRMADLFAKAGISDSISEEFGIEYLAELIVQECMKQCEQIRDDAFVQKKSEFLTQDGKMLYEGVYGGANNCGFAIQQYFGVEDES